MKHKMFLCSAATSMKLCGLSTVITICVALTILPTSLAFLGPSAMLPLRGSTARWGPGTIGASGRRSFPPVGLQMIYTPSRHGDPELTLEEMKEALDKAIKMPVGYGSLRRFDEFVYLNVQDQEGRFAACARRMQTSGPYRILLP